MTNIWWKYPLRWMIAKIRRLRGGVLAHALAGASDREIDDTLSKQGLTRADVFTPRGAIARHRVRMAHMLAAWQIDVARAVEKCWDQLKIADGVCSRCPNTGRCQRWLAWGQPNSAPVMFCPNVRLFKALATAHFGPATVDHCRLDRGSLDTRSHTRSPHLLTLSPEGKCRHRRPKRNLCDICSTLHLMWEDS